MRDFRRYLAYAVLGRENHPRARRRQWNGKGPARDWRYRAWIRSLPCLVCGYERSEAAHTGSDGGARLKASDYSCVPLCAHHHTMRADSYHRLGRESFEAHHRVNLRQAVEFLNLEWRESKWR